MLPFSSTRRACSTSRTSSGIGPLKQTSMGTSTWQERRCHISNPAAPSSIADPLPDWRAASSSWTTPRPRALSNAFTKSLAQNLLEKGIRVNCVAPGPVWTPLNPSDKPPEQVAQFGADTPMKRPAQPEEIAPAYVYFASDVDSSYVTGEVLTLLGGETTAA